jgi:hypothetical protein
MTGSPNVFSTRRGRSPEPPRDFRRERRDHDPVEGLAAFEHVGDRLEGPRVADLAVDLGVELAESLERRPEPTAREVDRLALGPHVIGRRGGGHQNVQTASLAFAELPELRDEVPTGERLVRNDQVSHGSSPASDPTPVYGRPGGVVSTTFVILAV